MVWSANIDSNRSKYHQYSSRFSSSFRLQTIASRYVNSFCTYSETPVVYSNMSEPRRTIFITDFHLFITRNILDSGILDMLAKDARVVIFVHKYKEAYFKELYEKGSVV